jgi:hypothetical protein
MYECYKFVLKYPDITFLAVHVNNFDIMYAAGQFL